MRGGLTAGPPRTIPPPAGWDALSTTERWRSQIALVPLQGVLQAGERVVGGAQTDVDERTAAQLLAPDPQ
jgi:hypothetical protein